MYLYEKKHITIQMHCKLDKSYRLYFILTKEIAYKEHLWPGATKVNLKNLKPSYDWMIWCRQQFEGISIMMKIWTFGNFWQESYLSL